MSKEEKVSPAIVASNTIQNEPEMKTQARKVREINFVSPIFFQEILVSFPFLQFLSVD